LQKGLTTEGVVSLEKEKIEMQSMSMSLGMSNKQSHDEKYGMNNVKLKVNHE